MKYMSLQTTGDKPSSFQTRRIHKFNQLSCFPSFKLCKNNVINYSSATSLILVLPLLLCPASPEKQLLIEYSFATTGKPPTRFACVNNYSPTVLNRAKATRLPPSEPFLFLLVIADIEPNIIQPYNWGLIPHWAKDDTIRSMTLNAKIETLHEKPSFRNSINKHCLITLPMDFSNGNGSTRKASKNRN
jgi:hypothetical protein